MNYKDIIKDELRNSAYIISGDMYIVKKSIEQIANKLNVANINIFEFNDENFDAVNVINCCNQFSFFNDKRIIVVKEIQKELNTNDQKLFINYIQSPNVNSLLLIIDNNGLFSFIKDIERIECKVLESDIVNFVITKFDENGKKIAEASAKVLVNFCKNDLIRLNIEIKKICDYLAEKDIVDLDVIQNLVTPDTEIKVFDLTTNLAKKDIEKSHKVLYDMLKAGEPPIKILGLISSHFRRVFFAKINKQEPKELANLLGCKEYAVIKAKQESANFTAKQLKDIQNLLLEVDYSIKSGLMSQENALYYLIMKIALI